MFMIKVPIQLLNEDTKMPTYATPGAACFDLAAATSKVVPAGKTVLVPLGIKVAIPGGYEMQIRPRSGVSLKTSLRIANAPGTIDSDYRGEVCALVENVGQADATVKKGERICQGCIKPIYKAFFDRVSSLPETDRGEGGFGSTGK